MMRDIALAVVLAALVAPLVILVSTCEVTTTSDGTCVKWGGP
jgi:membrane glycosyltransferase